MLGAALGVQAYDGAYRVTDKHVLEGPVRWDYLSVDSERHRLFLTRGDRVGVYDVRKREVVGSIPSTPGVHGVAVAADLGLGFSSNGASNSVTVFKLDTLAPQANVPVGSGLDALVYDTATRRVFVANGKDNSVSVVDAATVKVERTIALSGAPETAVVDGKGRLFVALEDRNAIAEIDTRKLKLIAEHRVAPVCDQPAGLTINPHAGLLYASCHNQKLVVVDIRTGKLVGTASIGRGNDAVAIDMQRKLVFASNGDGTLTVVDATEPFAVHETVDTMPRARTVTLDPATHKLYFVSAEAERTAMGAIRKAGLS